jgi:hypothetical protein
MSTITLSPMLVQYLVGLCCLRWDRDAVDVTIGDMVMDDAASKDRDVDVTVTVLDAVTGGHAFKAYEVKREGAALDVADVEALCLKLLDMPAITHRAIVSTSGYSEGAQAKAAHHGIELYQVRPWTRPLEEQFPLLTTRGKPDECFPMTQILLCWIEEKYDLVAPTAKCSFHVAPTDELFGPRGTRHGRYAAFGDYQRELLLRSTEILFKLEPAIVLMRTFPVPFSTEEGVRGAGPSWPHTHTLDVTADKVFVKVGEDLCRLDTITVTGFLRWERFTDRSAYYVMERVPSGETFAGALIGKEMREGHMTCLIFSPKTREMGIHFVRLTEKQNRAIRRLKVEVPKSAPEA